VEESPELGITKRVGDVAWKNDANFALVDEWRNIDAAALYAIHNALGLKCS
jgi:hypothetical protein